MIDDRLFESIVSIRRDIHQHPEIRFDVKRTAKIAAEEMRNVGIEVKEGTGVVGDLIVEGSEGTIALRADMDALPMQEENEISYKSKIDGKAHMCGHDSHTAMLIGVARLLAKNRSQLKKSVRFIFQPSEEHHPGGAPGMIREGCLDGVNEIYGLHVWPWLDVGKVGICDGPMMAQADMFDVIIKGKGGHAAAPHQTVDPIYVGAQIVSAIQSVISRNTDPIDSVVISITKFQAGTAHNVIPEHAQLSGTVRTYSEKTLKNIKSRIKTLVESVATGLGAEASLKYYDGYPPVINSAKESRVVNETARSFLDPSQVIFPADKAMFGEDFAYYLKEVPGCFIQLGCRNESKECIYPLHHPRFNLDEECMKTGMQLLVSLAMR